MGYTPNFMGNPLSSDICIFISLWISRVSPTISTPTIPVRFIKRQLSHAFELYIINSIASVKRYSILSYKICPQ